MSHRSQPRAYFVLPLPSSRIFDPPVAPLQLSNFTLSCKLILPPYPRTQITLHHVKAVFLCDSTHQETGLPSLFPSLVLSGLGSQSALASSLLARIQLAASHCRRAPSVLRWNHCYSAYTVASTGEFLLVRDNMTSESIHRPEIVARDLTDAGNEVETQDYPTIQRDQLCLRCRAIDLDDLTFLTLDDWGKENWGIVVSRGRMHL